MCDCLPGHYCECWDVPGCDGECGEAMMRRAGVRIPTDGDLAGISVFVSDVGRPGTCAGCQHREFNHDPDGPCREAGCACPRYDPPRYF